MILFVREGGRASICDLKGTPQGHCYSIGRVVVYIAAAAAAAAAAICTSIAVVV